jgi:lipopolysaccharide biosynthesis glycosyltransferase
MFADEGTCILNFMEFSVMDDLFGNAILASKTFSYAKQTVTSPIHIAFGVDDRYVRGMGVVISSILENNPDSSFVFHVFYGSMFDEDFTRLDTLAEKFATTVELHAINREIFSSLAPSGHYSHAIYNRLFVASVLNGVTERVLYLDADMVCLADVTEIITMDLAGNIAAVVSDPEQHVAGHVKRLGLQHGRYFNAGMMCMDIAAWNQADISAQALAVLNENKLPLLFQDQDALNIVLDGRALFIDKKWNVLYDLGSMTEEIPAETVILHYAGSYKPWVVWCQHPLQAHFLHYSSRSPWADVPFDVPRNYRDMRAYSKMLLKRGDTRAGYCWKWRYICERVSNKMRKLKASFGHK